MRESGIQGYEEAGNDLWFGAFAPAGTPKPVIDRLHAELVRALATPEVAERIRSQAYDRWTLTPADFATFLKGDYDKWGKVVRSSKATAD